MQERKGFHWKKRKRPISKTFGSETFVFVGSRGNALNKTLFVQLADSNARNHLIRLARVEHLWATDEVAFTEIEEIHERRQGKTIRASLRGWRCETVFSFCLTPGFFFWRYPSRNQKLVELLFRPVFSVLVSPPLFLRVRSLPSRVYFVPSAFHSLNFTRDSKRSSPLLLLY